MTVKFSWNKRRKLGRNQGGYYGDDSWLLDSVVKGMFIPSEHCSLSAPWFWMQVDEMLMISLTSWKTKQSTWWKEHMEVTTTAPKIEVCWNKTSSSLQCDIWSESKYIKYENNKTQIFGLLEYFGLDFFTLSYLDRFPIVLWPSPFVPQYPRPLVFLKWGEVWCTLAKDGSLCSLLLCL